MEVFPSTRVIVSAPREETFFKVMKTYNIPAGTPTCARPPAPD